ncbi:preprotein translocase subunit YajC [Amycolatopsis minnesotensis]|uniref:Preprotein translocase subunit YajC n=1 Tax=Amycolatopsis minnesotensis TaxID=337894 RepID=A0ABN2S2K4_9PSEU
MEQLLLPVLLMLVVAVPLVMGTRKQKRAAAQQQELQNSLSEGDRVMTTSGLYGTVANTDDDTTIDIEVAPGVVTTWLRQAVRERVEPVVEDDSADEDAPGSHEAIPAEEASASSVTTTSASSASSASSATEDKKTEESGAQIAPPLEHGKK